MNIPLSLLSMLMATALNGIMYDGCVGLCLSQPWSLGRVLLVAAAG